MIHAFVDFFLIIFFIYSVSFPKIDYYSPALRSKGVCLCVFVGEGGGRCYIGVTSVVKSRNVVMSRHVTLFLSEYFSQKL